MRCFIITFLLFTTIIICTVADYVTHNEQKCQKVNTQLCDIEKYFTVQPFNNTLGHTSVSTAIAELHKHAYLFQKENCKKNIQLFLCSLYTPVCVNNHPLEPRLTNNILLPCRDICESAKSACLKYVEATHAGWPQDWDCVKFKWYQDDKLCVINNANDTNNNQNFASTSSSAGLLTATTLAEPVLFEGSFTPGSELQTNLKPPLTMTNNSICADHQFDCKLRDKSKSKMGAFCIDKIFVCDGKMDCVRGTHETAANDTSEGLDEANCDIKCAYGQLMCDNRCINENEICNGQVDCSSGADEQNCYDNVTGIIQSTICIFALFSAIYLLIQFFKMEEKNTELDDQPKETTTNTNNSQQTCTREISNPQLAVEVSNQIRSLQEINQLYSGSSSYFPIYQEPAYERLITGGCSGASSEYMYGPMRSLVMPFNMNSSQTTTTMPSNMPSIMRLIMQDDSEDDLSRPPAAPPPTPVARESVYSSDSTNWTNDFLYVNMETRDRTDL